MTRQIRCAIVGCGKISEQYIDGCRQYPVLILAGCYDIVPERAREKAQQHGLVAYNSLGELLADGSIELVINLTVPSMHAEVTESCLLAGKHVYVEKPLALTSAECRRLIELAKKMDVKLCCAPDTFLGGGIQAAIKLVDDGAIGRPFSAMAFWLSRGHERWHPDPAFYYQEGGGPMFDMGPYYISALVAILGPVSRVSGEVRRVFPERTITSQPKAGTKVPVQVPTHYLGTMAFREGAIVSIAMSFDVVSYNLPRIVLFGTEGTLELPDPNSFGGNVRIRQVDDVEFRPCEMSHPNDRRRGTGVADMAFSILRPGRAERTSGLLAAHVVEVMAAFDTACRVSHSIQIQSTVARPRPLPVGLSSTELDE